MHHYCSKTLRTFLWCGFVHVFHGTDCLTKDRTRCEVPDAFFGPGHHWSHNAFSHANLKQTLALSPEGLTIYDTTSCYAIPPSLCKLQDGPKKDHKRPCLMETQKCHHKVSMQEVCKKLQRLQMTD